MECFIFAVLIIITIIVLVVVFRTLYKIIFKLSHESHPIIIGSYCEMTSDCATGLSCDQSICSIPIGGCCVNHGDMCAQHGKCVKGMCVTDSNIEMSPVLYNVKKDDPVVNIAVSHPVIVATPQVVPATQLRRPTTLAPTLPPRSYSEVNSPASDAVIVSPIMPFRQNNKDYSSTFHRLTFSDGKEVTKGENILDASYGMSNNLGYMWYITSTENNHIINVKDYSGNYTNTVIAKNKSGVSCQAFGKICYVLVKDSKDVFGIQKFSLKDNTLEVEFPHFPKHNHVKDCINLGVSALGVIMIVTEESMISFNPDSLKDDVSSWFISKRDNNDVLYMNYIKGNLFSLTEDQWFYKDTFGQRQENSYPIVTEKDTVENKPYWAKEGLFLFDSVESH
jgi:hypothetical protein